MNYYFNIKEKQPKRNKHMGMIVIGFVNLCLYIYIYEYV